LPPAAAALGLAAAQRRRTEAVVVAECGSCARRSPRSPQPAGPMGSCAFRPTCILHQTSPQDRPQGPDPLARS
jgi:hypothetical protein